MKAGFEKVKQAVSRFFEYVGTFIPTSLPVGVTEYTAWQDSVLSFSNVPDNDSTRFAVSSLVLHLGQTESKKAKQYFIRSLNAGATKQVAHAQMLELKAKQEAAVKAQQESNLQQPAGSNGVASVTQISPAQS